MNRKHLLRRYADVLDDIRLHGMRNRDEAIRPPAIDGRRNFEVPLVVPLEMLGDLEPFGAMQDEHCFRASEQRHGELRIEDEIQLVTPRDPRRR